MQKSCNKKRGQPAQNVSLPLEMKCSKALRRALEHLSAIFHRDRSTMLTSDKIALTNTNIRSESILRHLSYFARPITNFFAGTLHKYRKPLVYPEGKIALAHTIWLHLAPILYLEHPLPVVIQVPPCPIMMRFCAIMLPQLYPKFDTAQKLCI